MILKEGSEFPFMPRDACLSDSQCNFLQSDSQISFVSKTTCAQTMINPFMPTGAFNICCLRDCVSRHNGGTSGAPLKPLRDDSALR